MLTDWTLIDNDIHTGRLIKELPLKYEDITMFDLSEKTVPDIVKELAMTDTNTRASDSEKTPLIVALGSQKTVLDSEVVDYMMWLRENKICEFHIIYDLKDLPQAMSKLPECFLFADEDVTVGRNSLPEFMMMLKTLMSFTNPDSDMKIGYMLDKSTPYNYIKELQRLGVTGLVPGLRSYDKDETTKGLDALLNGIPYWPKHFIDALPGKVSKQKRETVHLTHRQREVLELIANRGLTNKQIARVLNISESTVKIHVSAIMKAYCVRNRTQLALTKK